MYIFVCKYIYILNNVSIFNNVSSRTAYIIETTNMSHIYDVKFPKSHILKCKKYLLPL